jgi:hypothetical protein
VCALRGVESLGTGLMCDIVYLYNSWARILVFWVFSFPGCVAARLLLSCHSLPLSFVGYGTIERHGVILARGILSGESVALDAAFRWVYLY